MVDSVPDEVNLEFRGIQQGICLASCVLQARTQSIYHRVHNFTDSAEALRFLIGIQRKHSTAYSIKLSCTSLHQTFGTPVTVRWVPGHTGHPGNESTKRLASEASSLYRRQPGEKALPAEPASILRKRAGVTDMLGALASNHQCPRIRSLCLLTYFAERRCF